MLLAPALIDDSSCKNVENIDEPEGPPNKRKKQTDKPKRDWVKTDLKSELPEWTSDDAKIEELRNKNLTPKGYFELFFDDEVLNLIVDETNRYASQKNRNLTVDKHEIKCFIGTLFLSGYLAPARRRLYWENASDTHHDLVTNAMRRDKFEAIFTNFHLADNNCLDEEDKFAKLRPLIKLLNQKFQRHSPNEEFYSFDESMCEYYGRHGCKQFLRGKPIRFGFKIWCGTTPLGYLIWFDPYQGKSASSRPQDNGLGLGGNLVSHFADVLTGCGRKFFHLCYDNFFNSVKLVTMLKDKLVKATGTIRENRTEKCPLTSNDALKKQGRGKFDFKTDTKNDVLVCKWNDNSVVNLCSNAAGVHPISKASRYSSSEKKRVQIDQPFLIKLYNEHMGGVDRMDQNVSKYRIGLRGKKWYWCLISYMLDVSINNAWQLQKICNNKNPMDMLQFRRYIVRTYLSQYGKPPEKGMRGKPQDVLSDIRYDGYKHWVIPQNGQTKCRHCHMKTTTRCEKCDVGLHVKCFKDHHSL